VEEVYAPAVADFVYITDDAYTAAELKAMEIKILRVIDFDLSRPVSLHFLRRFSKAGDVDVLQHGLAKMAAEAALLEYSLVAVPGSKVAAAALLLSLIVLEVEGRAGGTWGPGLAYYSGYTRDELLPVVAALAQAVTSLTSK